MSTRPVDLAVRDRHPEVMDGPGLDPVAHRGALRGLARVNGLSGTAGRLWWEIRPLFARTSQPLRILDVACGGGDVAIAIARRARREGRTVEVSGCDVSEVAIERARERAAGLAAGVSFERRDVLREGLPEEFDVVCCSLFLHHLSDAEALAFLVSAGREARRMVLVSDLVRSRWGYALARWGGQVLSRSPIVHVDGPLSVRAAFTASEARDLASRAGLEGATVTQHWPARFLLAWSRPADGR
jgi:2-polyprenyl-3-methyl-5-hydroxy-6-metoxy-1,4-benzoquinol methylase